MNHDENSQSYVGKSFNDALNLVVENGQVSVSILPLQNPGCCEKSVMGRSSYPVPAMYVCVPGHLPAR